ncbi:hypothetical protein [Nitrosopumilus sp. b1]|nr:hypothetical protein [Nitrosopumilus sp. b1]
MTMFSKIPKNSFMNFFKMYVRSGHTQGYYFNSGTKVMRGLYHE